MLATGAEVVAAEAEAEPTKNTSPSNKSTELGPSCSEKSTKSTLVDDVLDIGKSA
jgi:hypothetical protein